MTTVETKNLPSVSAVSGRVKKRRSTKSTHPEKYVFVCTYPNCRHSFTAKKSLNRHIVNVHKNEHMKPAVHSIQHLQHLATHPMPPHIYDAAYASQMGLVPTVAAPIAPTPLRSHVSPSFPYSPLMQAPKHTAQIPTGPSSVLQTLRRKFNQFDTASPFEQDSFDTQGHPSFPNMTFSHSKLSSYLDHQAFTPLSPESDHSRSPEPPKLSILQPPPRLHKPSPQLSIHSMLPTRQLEEEKAKLLACLTSLSPNTVSLATIESDATNLKIQLGFAQKQLRQQAAEIEKSRLLLLQREQELAQKKERLGFLEKRKLRSEQSMPASVK